MVYKQKKIGKHK